MRRMRQTFDEQLEILDKRLTEMGTFVRDMMGEAVRALVEQDVELATKVIADDDIADEMDLSIEQTCMRLLALQQPMSKDLRAIGTALKMIADLERIGDYSVDIARTARILASEPLFKPLVDIPKMAEIARRMVDLAMEAFSKRDLVIVQRVVDDDELVDEMWYALLEELVQTMQERSEVVKQATYLLLVARYLERIADHAVNVAERVAYVVTGELQTLAPSHGAQ